MLATLTGVVVLLLALLMLFAWRVVYRPHYDAVPDEPVDALLVLGPLEPWRLELAEQWMQQGKARNLVLSTPTLPQDAVHCEPPHEWPTYCFPPEPSTTRGEAVGLKRLAEEHGWQSMAVLTIDFHAARTRFIFERCLGHPVPVVGRHLEIPQRFLRYHVAYQLGGFAKEIALGSCEP
ncbi:hypothetical protein [Luteococcus sp. OSA5]|uniref:hypothetical protein n=1 Tax=Luteococcus sp. OSA5 TaxID=3401630 RepID=UPI003B4369A8